MVVGSWWLMNRSTMRVVAIGLLAFPEPVISDILALALFAVSFMIPDGGAGMGRASACGCDYHRRGCHGRPVMGAGALVHERKWVVPRIPAVNGYETERYGFIPVGLPFTQPSVGLRKATVAAHQGSPYPWHTWPKLEGTLLRRLSGFGQSAAVRCEVIR